jgi:hypothetical protein
MRLLQQKKRSDYYRFSEFLASLSSFDQIHFQEYITLMNKNHNSPIFKLEKDKLSFKFCLLSFTKLQNNYNVDMNLRLDFLTLVTRIFIESYNLIIVPSLNETCIFAQLHPVTIIDNDFISNFLKLKIIQLETLPHLIPVFQSKLDDIVKHYDSDSQFYQLFKLSTDDFKKTNSSMVITSLLSLALRTKTVSKLSFVMLALHYSLITLTATPELFYKILKDGLKMMQKSSALVYKFTARIFYFLCQYAESIDVDLGILKSLIEKYNIEEKNQKLNYIWESLKVLQINQKSSTLIIDSIENMNFSKKFEKSIESSKPSDLIESKDFIKNLALAVKSSNLNNISSHLFIHKLIIFMVSNIPRHISLFPIFDLVTVKYKELTNLNYENISFIQSTLPLMSSMLISLQQNKRLRNFSKLFFYFGNLIVTSNPEKSYRFWYLYIQSETVLLNSNESQLNIMKKFNYVSTNELLKLNMNGVIILNCAFLNSFIYKDLKPLGCEKVLNEDMHSILKILAKSCVQDNNITNLLFEFIENESLTISLSVAIIDLIENSELSGKEQIISSIILNVKEKTKDTGLFLYFLSKISFIVNFPINFKNSTLNFNLDSNVIEIENLVVSHLYILQAFSESIDPSDIVLKSYYLITKYLEVCEKVPYSEYELNIIQTIFKTLKYHELYKYCSLLLESYINIRKPVLNISTFELLCSYWLIVNFKLENYSICDFICPESIIVEHKSYEIMDLSLSILEYQLASNSTNLKDIVIPIFKSFQTDLFAIDKQPDKYKATELLILYARFCKIMGLYLGKIDKLNSIINLNRAITILQSMFKNFLLPNPTSPSLNVNFKSVLKMDFSYEILDCYKYILEKYSVIGFGKEFDHYLNELELFIKIQPSVNLKYNYSLKLMELNLLKDDLKKASKYQNEIKELESRIFVDTSIINEIYSYIVYESYARKSRESDQQTETLSRKVDNLIFNLLNSTNKDAKVSQSIVEKWGSSLKRRYSYLTPTELKDYKLKLHSCMESVVGYHNCLKTLIDKGGNKEIICFPLDGIDCEQDSKSVLFVKDIITCLNSLISDFMIYYQDTPNEITKHNLELITNSFQNLIQIDGNNKSSNGYEKVLSLTDQYKLLPFKLEKLFAKNFTKQQKFLPEFQNDTFDCFIKEDFEIIKSITLPPDWMAVTIDYILSSNTLMITKYVNNSYKNFNKNSYLPLSINISLDKKKSSNGYDRIVNKLQAIIEESDKTTMSEVTSKIKTHDEKIKWWSKRKELDKQLENLLKQIDCEWFGGFNSIFQSYAPSEKDTLCIKKEIIGRFVKHIKLINKKFDAKQIANSLETVDERIYKMFLKIENVTENKILDLLKLVYQLVTKEEAPNRSAELVVMSKMLKLSIVKFSDNQIFKNLTSKNHIVLIPGSSCAKIPWESIPSLRGKSVTRMPSIYQLGEYLNKYKDLLDNGINSNKGYYVINPGSDLKRTEENLAPRFQNLQSWNGIVGKAPSENEILEGISNSNMYIYAGHGGGEQYIKSKTIKSQSYIPPTLLLGCSSGSLKGSGSMHLYGTAYNYINGGCPMVLVNLWDVTDKDIDLFTVDALTKWGFFVDYDSFDPFDMEIGETLAQCVMKARNVCKLRYLNGAAPIIYGLPLKLECV